MGSVGRWVIVSSVWLGASAAIAEDRAELTALIREGNGNSLGSIRTLHARYETEQTTHGPGAKSPPTVTKMEWWQDGKRIRWTEEAIVQEIARPGKPDAPARPLVTDGLILESGEVKLRRYERSADGKPQPRSGTITSFSRDHVIPGDVWAVSLCVPLSRPRTTLAELLSVEGRVQEITPITADGGTGFRILTQAPPPLKTYRMEIDIDPKRNFMITRVAPSSTSPTEATRYIKEVVGAQECAPGVYFPKAVVSRTYKVGPEKKLTLQITNKTSFHSVKANEPIHPSIFSLDFDAGTSVQNHQNRTSYVVGKDNKPEGPVTTIPEVGSRPVVAMPAYEERGYRYPSSFEIVVAVGLGLLAGGAVWLWRRRNRPQDSAGTR